MPRITIQQFRAILAERTSPGALVRAYRELTRRPDVAAGMTHAEWMYWTQVEARAPA